MAYIGKKVSFSSLFLKKKTLEIRELCISRQAVCCVSSSADSESQTQSKAIYRKNISVPALHSGLNVDLSRKYHHIANALTLTHKSTRHRLPISSFLPISFSAKHCHFKSQFSHKRPKQDPAESVFLVYYPIFVVAGLGFVIYLSAIQEL